MGTIVDVVLCLLAIVIIVKHTIRGFVRSVFGAMKLIIAVFLTCVLTPLLFAPEDVESKIIAYLFVFTATYVVLTIVIFILDKICSLPLLNQANKLLGFLLGIVSAYITLCILCAIFSLVLTLAGEQLFNETLDNVIETTYIFRYFNEAGFFPLIGK